MKKKAGNTNGPRKAKFKYAGKHPDHEYRKKYSKDSVRFWEKAWKAYKRGDLFFKHKGEVFVVPRVKIEDEEE